MLRSGDLPQLYELACLMNDIRDIASLGTNLYDNLLNVYTNFFVSAVMLNWLQSKYVSFSASVTPLSRRRYHKPLHSAYRVPA